MSVNRTLWEFTRDESYYLLDDLGEKQKKVYNLLRRSGALSNRMIAKKLGWEINTVTPRVKELRERDLVELAGLTVDNDTKRQVVAWRVKT